MISYSTLGRYAIGGGIGLAMFVVNIGSMEGVFFRPDDNNELQFTLNGLWCYLKAPLSVGTQDFNTIWTNLPNMSMRDRLKMLSMNWIVMTTAGVLFAHGSTKCPP